LEAGCEEVGFDSIILFAKTLIFRCFLYLLKLLAV